MQDTVDQAHDAVPRILADIIQDARLGMGRRAGRRQIAAGGHIRCDLAAPGGLGESHPQAPTERSVTVSRHSARPIYRLFWKSVIHAQ
jgi:hypothetical protein